MNHFTIWYPRVPKSTLGTFRYRRYFLGTGSTFGTVREVSHRVRVGISCRNPKWRNCATLHTTDKQLDPKLYLVDFNLLIRGLFRHTIPLFCYRQIFKNLFQVIDVSSGKTKFKSQKMANFYEQRIERLESENLDMRGEILR